MRFISARLPVAEMKPVQEPLVAGHANLEEHPVFGAGLLQVEPALLPVPPVRTENRLTRERRRSREWMHVDEQRVVYPIEFDRLADRRIGDPRISPGSSWHGRRSGRCSRTSILRRSPQESAHTLRHNRRGGRRRQPSRPVMEHGVSLIVASNQAELYCTVVACGGPSGKGRPGPPH